MAAAAARHRHAEGATRTRPRRYGEGPGLPRGGEAQPLPAPDDGPGASSYAHAMALMNMRSQRGSAPRRSLIADGILGAALAAFVTVGTYFASQHQPTRRPFDAWTIVLIGVAAGALALRRRHPVAVMTVVFGATLLYFILGYANGPIWLTLIVAYVTAVVRGHRLAAAVAAVAGVGLFPWLDTLLRNGPAPSLAGVAAVAAWLLVLLGAAEAVRMRRERAAETVRIQEEEALRRASEERLRIARELHDALGHHLSLINVQSGVALHLNEDLPEQAQRSLAAIKQASKEALAELRSVLDILRQEGEPAPRSPTSTLARLDELVSQAAAAGLEVRTETDGRVRPRPCGAQRGGRRQGDRGHARAGGGARRAPGGRAPAGWGVPGAGPPAPGRRRMIRVLLADDQALVRAGVRVLLDAQDDIEVVGEAGDGETALRMTADLAPD